MFTGYVHTIAQNRLGQALAQLETLGLRRPANVLLAEYLSALTAEGVLDGATAEQVCAAFNSVRYSSVPVDDPQLSEAIASLEQVGARLAAMTPEDRQQLAERVCGLVQLPAVAQQNDIGRHNQIDCEAGEGAGSPPEVSDQLDRLVSSSPPANRRRSPVPRVSLQLCALAVLATFFGGYFFREAIYKSAGAGDDFSNARVSLELVLAYAPDNPMALNDLAALYLISDERGGGSRPMRALDLAERALEFSREPLILDTAAEAQFQCGNIREAIRLERESLNEAFEDGEAQFSAEQDYRRKQLQKFRDADRVGIASPDPPTPK
jgi:hypothetical protein